MLQCVTMCCSVLQFVKKGLESNPILVALCCKLHSAIKEASYRNVVLQHAVVCCSVLQCVAVRCSVLQCAAACCSSVAKDIRKLSETHTRI